MKIIFLILIWINRIIMLLFLSSIFLLFLDSNFVFLSAFITGCLGIFQFFSFLIISSKYDLFEEAKRKLLQTYIKLIIIFVLGLVLILTFNFLDVSIFKFIFRLIPVFLAFFWTYIIESFKLEL